MTLIMSATVGGYASIMTADTRQVGSLGKVSFRYNDEPNKVEFITGYVMYGAGGDSSLANLVKERLRKLVTWESDLGDCYKALQTVLADYDAKLADETSLQLILNGFTHDGQCGKVTFVSGDGAEPTLQILAPGRFNKLVIAPTADHVSAIANQVREPQLDDVSTAIDNISSYLVNIHMVAAFTNDELVSPTCKVYVLRKNLETGALDNYTTEIDTAQYFEALQ